MVDEDIVYVMVYDKMCFCSKLKFVCLWIWNIGVYRFSLFDDYLKFIVLRLCFDCYFSVLFCVVGKLNRFEFKIGYVWWFFKLGIWWFNIC